jgi:F0F1-type ATP synthase membrane subunit a
MNMLIHSLLASAAAHDPLDHVRTHPLNIHIGPFALTNQMLMALVAAVLMALVFPILFRRAQSDAPHGARNFFESILEFLRVEIFRPALKEHTDRFTPFLWTLFFFILFCNLLGQIPLNEIATLLTRGKPQAWGGTATGSPATTGALALCAFLYIHFHGIAQVARSLRDGTYGHHGHHEEHSSDGGKAHEAAIDLPHARAEGLPADVPQDVKALTDPSKHYADDQHARHHHHKPDNGDLHGTEPHGRGMNTAAAALLAVPLYFWNFAPHPFKPAPGGSVMGWLADLPVWLMLLVLELVGALIKPFALMIRLFANMIAGHIVLAALILLIPVGASLAHQIGIGAPVTILSLLIRMLELFVAFLQAYIFTFLTCLFIASAVAPEH